MEQMIEQPQPPEGDEATTSTMSPLAAVRQYLSTNSAKSMFPCNTGLVVKAIPSKLPHDQDMQAQSNVVSALQTRVHSLTETLCETRTDRTGWKRRKGLIGQKWADSCHGSNLAH